MQKEKLEKKEEEKPKSVIPSFDEAFNASSDLSFVGKKKEVWKSIGSDGQVKETAIKFFNVNEGIKKGALSMEEIVFSHNDLNA